MKIITHNGRAHADDFLATCVLLHKLDCAAFRCEATSADLADEHCWVLDQGRDFNKSLHNFDHHQTEDEICSFTMVLDYFYNNNYRENFPQFRIVEIFDSYGPKRVAEYLEIKEDKLDYLASPISECILKLFSKIDGEIKDPILSIMRGIGKEICDKIESQNNLLEILEDSVYFEFEGIKILDVTNCKPGNFKFDQLPTKNYCKLKNITPEVILTVDTRNNGFRMVSVNTDCVKFAQSEFAYFTHNSGFLTCFNNYEDYKKICLSLKK